MWDGRSSAVTAVRAPAVEYLDIDDVLALADRLLGTPVPIRDLGLLGSAVARPQITVGGDDAYPDLWTKAAALLQSIVNNHALIDGDKRLGWLATAVFLDLNGTNVTAAANSDVSDLVIDVASNLLGIDDIATRLAHLVPVARDRPSR
jgi:death on curing protein